MSIVFVQLNEFTMKDFLPAISELFSKKEDGLSKLSSEKYYSIHLNSSAMICGSPVI